jgi:sulfatase maturation enzyme AslB (radical SAM superfamily)
VLPQLTNLDLYGGEPFLLKNLHSLLQKAVELDYAKNIRLHFNTNGSIFPETLVSLFKHFKEIDVALSIDNIGKRFELERGGKWEDVEQNVIKFLSLPIRAYIFPTVNIQNILYLDELLDWADEIGIDVTCNLLHGPKHFNINFMTEDAKRLVVNRLSNSKHEILRTFSEQVTNSQGSDGVEFVRHVKEYDFRRNEDFIATHPEIARAMGYIL